MCVEKTFKWRIADDSHWFIFINKSKAKIR